MSQAIVSSVVHLELLASFDRGVCVASLSHASLATEEENPSRYR